MSGGFTGRNASERPRGPAVDDLALALAASLRGCAGVPSLRGLPRLLGGSSGDRGLPVNGSIFAAG